eukprot:Em0016g822a
MLVDTGSSVTLVHLPPYHEMRLQVQLEGANTDGDYVGLFQPKAEMSTQHGLLFACSLSPVHDGKAVVQLVNPSAIPVTLHCKEKVGLFHPHGMEERERIWLSLHWAHDFRLDQQRQLPARKLPFHQRDVVQKMIQGMLQQGIIEPSGGAWASPIVLVRKKDGSYRFCVDFRRLNSITKKDVHPLPRIDDALDTLSGSKWFSTLDLASGYWQVEMDPADKEKTAFITPFGLHQFRVMPFGLTNAPSTFQRLMSTVLAGLSWRLTEVLQRLKEAGLKIKPSKCHLLCKSVRYLGYVVSEKGIAADADRNFADIAAPLHALTEKSKPWHWTERCDKAFVALKVKLASPPILSFPQFDRTFVVDADASQEGVGAVLSNLDDGRVIAYASRVLTKAECQYCATRRELLALVWSVRQFRAYLWGRRFVVRTDHSALRWLRSFKDPQGQVARWLEILAEFDFDVIHRPGLRHGNADALSRIQCKQCGMHNGSVTPCLFHNAFGAGNSGDLWSGSDVHSEAALSVVPLEDPKEMQGSDADLKRVISWIENSSPPAALPSEGSYTLQTLWAQYEHLVIRDGVLFRQWEDVPGKGCNKHLQLVVPRSSIGSVLQQLHSSPSGGHLGIFKTLEKVRSRFYWPGQRHDIEDWCRACELCAARKSPPRSNRAPMQQVLAGGPFQRVAMDILGPLPLTDRGNKYILVLGDYFTKWVESFPIPNMEAKTIANMFVGHFVSRFGAPDVLHTDQGRNFESALFKEVCLLLGVHKTRTTPYHPQSDGIAAREDEQNWDLCIPTVMLAYRTSVQESTGCTPYFLLFGREARLPVDVMFGLPPSVTPQPVHQYSKDLRVRLNIAYERNSTRKKVVVHFDRLKACARGGTFEQGTTATRDAAEESQPDVSDAEESEDDNLVIDHQEGNLEPEQQEVEPQDDQQEQPPVETLPPLRKSKRLRSRPDRFGTNIFD